MSDPLVVLAVGVLGGLIGGFVQARLQRSQWLRDRRLDLYSRAATELSKWADLGGTILATDPSVREPLWEDLSKRVTDRREPLTAEFAVTASKRMQGAWHRVAWADDLDWISRRQKAPPDDRSWFPLGDIHHLMVDDFADEARADLGTDGLADAVVTRMRRIWETVTTRGEATVRQPDSDSAER